MKKYLTIKRIISILFSIILVLSFASCTDEREAYHSVPLVELTVDTSRYLEEGFIDFTMINHSGVDITYDWTESFVFENGGWHRIPNDGPIKEIDRWYALSAGESKESMINLTEGRDAGRYMLMVRCMLPVDGATVDDAPYIYYATAVYDLPEK